MSKQKVLVNFIQDRSGSMQSVWSETLSGFKTFVQELQSKDDVDYLFSLTTFDTLVETPIIAAEISSVDVDTLKQYGPRGSTALYDAVGTTIKNTDDHRHGADKIICVIVTDGQENSSREWDKDKLQKAIESHLTAGDWTFTYLGTQPETWDDAGALGVSAASASSYIGQNAAQTYAATAFGVARLASSHLKSTRSFVDDFVPDAMATAAGMGKAKWGGASSAGKSVAPPSVKTKQKVSDKKWR